MAKRIQFQPELRDWLLHNLDRGIPPAPLVRTMGEQGFDAAVAGDLVLAFWHARAMGIAPPVDVVEPEQVLAARYRHEPQRLRIGHDGCNEVEIDGQPIRLALQLEQPQVTLLDNIFTPAECDQLMALSTPRLRPSTIVDAVTGKDTVSAARSSEGMFFRLGETPLIDRLDARLSSLMNLPVENGEGLQVLRYRGGEQSVPHYDFLMANNAANAASLERSGQRVSTLIVYLNEVERGGQTAFPESGLAVTPRRGCGLYFEYCNSAGQLDPQSLHAALPVLAGEKWIVTKWMRQRRFVPA